MTDSTPEGGEPTPFREKAKGWYETRKPKILAVGGAVVAVGAVALTVAVAVARNAVEQNAPEGTGAAEDTESAAEPAKESEPRNSPGRHTVSPHKRRLADGREIDVSGYERGGSSEDEGEDEDPGDAAA
ncbi:hypothetical protein E5082_13865 [Streptomyces griseoluteus]|uniref:Uncharacterized protein n=1 Tax=Streptomyces griseoluteus TaxID=29306 RepID=A0A4Z1DLL6_STRGP|nr:hypothetical protein [Streptomyces griseoluteus]TGN83918.1 hypothetical protein E5082_13865 [Streptomyces griseoluteus]